MKYILLLIVAIIAGCKSQKTKCPKFTGVSDTVHITPNHYHIQSKYKCVWNDTCY